jgi:hypothetical protein
MLKTPTIAFSHEQGSPGYEFSAHGSLQAASVSRRARLSDASADFRFPANRFLTFFNHFFDEPEVMVHRAPPVSLTSLIPVITFVGG